MACDACMLVNPILMELSDNHCAVVIYHRIVTRHLNFKGLQVIFERGLDVGGANLKMDKRRGDVDR